MPQFDSVNEARQWLNDKGLSVHVGTDEILEQQWNLFADYQVQQGIPQGMVQARRDEYMNNWRGILKGTKADDKYILSVSQDIANELQRGAIGNELPFFIRKQSLKINETYVGGMYQGDGGWINILQSAKPLPHRSQGITDALASVADSYSTRNSGVVTHEYGHYWAKEVSKGTELRASLKIEELWQDKITRSWVKKNISYYATTNAQEMAAEAYTMWKHVDFDLLSAEVKEYILEVLVG